MSHACRNIGLVVTAVIVVLLANAAASAFTLDQVKQRDELFCGVSSDDYGFSKPDAEGNWHGLNVDICKAAAAAVLGDAAKVKFVPLTNKTGVTAILSGEVDLLSMNMEWNMSYDTSIGLNFCGVSFYDGLGFMVPLKRSITSALELQNSSVCPDPSNPDFAHLESFFSRHNLQYRIVQVERVSELKKVVESGRCDVISGDISRLSRLRLQFSEPDDYQVLPETISRKPLGPVVRQGDDGWFNIVKWVLFALKIAEDEGVTSANIETMRASDDPDIQKLLGVDGIKGKGLGLADDWVVRIITEVGNYGEIFERNLGMNSTLSMDRNINEPWNRGGLHYGPSVN